MSAHPGGYHNIIRININITVISEFLLFSTTSRIIRTITRIIRDIIRVIRAIVRAVTKVITAIAVGGISRAVIISTLWSEIVQHVTILNNYTSHRVSTEVAEGYHKSEYHVSDALSEMSVHPEVSDK